MAMSPSRRSVALVIAVLLTASAAACTPTPEPTPTPTGFASEDEAFAAAEATYRAYIDALNARNAGDKDADPKIFTTGEALEAETSSEKNMTSRGLHIAGKTSLVDFQPQEYRVTNDGPEVLAEACLDASESTVVNEQNEDVTPDDFEPVYVLAVGFTSVNNAFMISETSLARQGDCR